MTLIVYLFGDTGNCNPVMEWEKLVGWKKIVGGRLFMIYRLCFVNFEPCDYFTSWGEGEVLNLNLYSNTHTHTIKVAPFVHREIQLLKMIFKSLIELQPSGGIAGEWAIQKSK